MFALIYTPKLSKLLNVVQPTGFADDLFIIEIIEGILFAI